MSDLELRTDLAVLRSDLQHLSNSVDDLKDTLRWLNRLVLAAVISAVLGVVVYTGGA